MFADNLSRHVAGQAGEAEATTYDAAFSNQADCAVRGLRYPEFGVCQPSRVGAAVLDIYNSRLVCQYDLRRKDALTYTWLGRYRESELASESSMSAPPPDMQTFN